MSPESAGRQGVHWSECRTFSKSWREQVFCRVEGPRKEGTGFGTSCDQAQGEKPVPGRLSRHGSLPCDCCRLNTAIARAGSRRKRSPRRQASPKTVLFR